MSTPKDSFRSACPINIALELLGDKWSLLVIRDMVFMRKKYFKEFQASPESIATNILTNRLQSLEAEGIITRVQDPDNARQVIYSLTSKGIDLIPTLVDLILWGSAHSEKNAIPTQILKRIRQDREGYITELTDKLKKQ